MTLAPAPPVPATAVGAAQRAGRPPDLLDRLRARATGPAVVDAGLAGGLRAWLEDGVADAAVAAGRVGAVGPLGALGAVVVRDGEVVTAQPQGRGRSRGIGLEDLRSSLARALFRLSLTDGPPRQPFEDALCALSVTERGPQVLDEVRLLRPRERASLRAYAHEVAAAIAVHWRRVPPAWLPRTGERLRVPLAGGAVLLSATADLVLGRPSDGSASVCLLQLCCSASGGGGAGGGDAGAGGGDAGDGGGAARACRALALAETLRSGAPPWRVARYDPGVAARSGAGGLHCEEVDAALLADAVRDVLGALAGCPDPR